MSALLISVVIPAHNCARLLGECLQHLTAQTLPPQQFEVVVVDDHSSDATAETAERFAADAPFELRVVRRSANEGPGAARNSGIAASKAPLIALLDADTEPQPDWLAAGVRALERHDLVEGATVIGSRHLASPFTHQTENLRGGGFPTCNMFLKRTVFDRVGLFDTRFYDRRARIHFREDTEFALRVLEAGIETGFEPEAVTVHRPLSPAWKRPFQLAKRYRHDRLLRHLHPNTFSDWTDVYFIGGRKWHRLRQKLYWGYLGACAVAVVLFLAGLPLWPAMAPAAFCLAGIWWLHVRIMGRRALYSPISLAAVPVAAAVPFVYLASVVAGVRLHKNSGVAPKPQGVAAEGKEERV